MKLLLATAILVLVFPFLMFFYAHSLLFFLAFFHRLRTGESLYVDNRLPVEAVVRFFTIGALAALFTEFLIILSVR